MRKSAREKRNYLCSHILYGLLGDYPLDRKLPSIALIALLLTLFLPSLGYGYWKGEEGVEPLDHYYIEVFLDEREYKLSGYLVLHHFNKHSVAFRELYFHVYPNAFKPWNGSVEI
ncbi:MAG: hypothetical protein DRJ59_06585, partial [Thermoprotei archaeon]